MKTKLTEAQYKDMAEYFAVYGTLTKLEEIIEVNSYCLTEDQLSAIRGLRMELLQRSYVQYAELVEKF